MSSVCGAVRYRRSDLRTAAFFVAAVSALALPIAGTAAAAQTITVSGNPAAMRISTATAGSEPKAITTATTTYNVKNSNAISRITAKLSTALPAGVTLTINLQAPTGATSLGAVTLTTTAQNVVTNIPKNRNQNTLTITYVLSATAAAGVVNVSSKTVTLLVGP
jgi:hypothetical protein